MIMKLLNSIYKQSIHQLIQNLKFINFNSKKFTLRKNRKISKIRKSTIKN